jgi:type I restriction enzyme S subunit
MITEQSNYYFRFHDEVESRFDFVFCHPSFDKLIEIKKRFKYPVKNVGDFVVKNWTGENLEQRDKKEKKYLYVKVENVSNNSINITSNSEFLSDSELEILSNSIPKSNSLLVTRVGSFGRCAVVGSNFIAAISDNILCFELDEANIDPFFISYFINHEIGQMQILRQVAGSSQGVITYDKIKNIFLGLPPEKSKQVHISQTISLIDSIAKELESKSQESLVQANKILLDELGIDLPEEEISYFFKEGRQDSSDYYYRFNEEIGDRFHYLFNHPKLKILDKLKNKYQTVSLKSICREPIKRGEQPEYSDFGIMVIKTVDLKNCFIDYENTLRVSKDFFELKPQAHIQKDDILVSSTGYVSVGKIDVFDLEEPAFADGHISIVRLNTDYDTYFVTYFLRSVLGQLQFEKWFTGSSGQIEVQPEDLNRFILPGKESLSIDKQKEIADKITEEYKKAGDYEQQAQLKWQEAKELFEKLILEDVEK